MVNNSVEDIDTTDNSSLCTLISTTFASVLSTMLAGFFSLAQPIIFAGAPTAVAPMGIGLRTMLPAPIFAPSPIVMFPIVRASKISESVSK